MLYSINPQAPHFTNTIPLHPPQSKVLYGITNSINFPLTKDIGKQVGIVMLFLRVKCLLQWPFHLLENFLWYPEDTHQAVSHEKHLEFKYNYKRERERERERERALARRETWHPKKKTGQKNKERKHEEYYYCTWTVITNYAVERFNGTSYESVNSYVTRRQRCDLIMWEFCHVFTDASLITSDSPFPWVMGPDTAEQSARFRVLKGKATSTVMSSSNSSSK